MAAWRPDINCNLLKETNNMLNQRFIPRLAALFLALAVCCASAQAQPTTFTYQGKLTDGGNPANGTFDLQFAIFDVLSGGAALNAPLTREDVTVTNGVFTVQLDFGASAFTGAARFLEISVRPGASAGAFTLLTPRQPVQSTPYAIRSLNAASADVLSAVCVGCVTDTQIGGLPAGNGNYIQNTNAQQAGSNFNISGNGTVGGTLSAGLVNATTQFNLNGSRVLSAPGTGNLLAGGSPGGALTTGSNNSFIGRSSGNGTTTGSSNSFFGLSAGAANTTGGNNTVLGAGANVSAGNLDFATALGAGATVGASNTIVLGRSGGQDAVSVPGVLTANGAGVTNLNAANITTGTLGTARGGTGLTAAGATGNLLRSDGTNWTSAALQAADVPGGSNNYIQNTAALQTASNFNISGNGTAGGTLSGGSVNATTQFNLNGQRILAAGALSLFAGIGAGALTTGGQNTFVGANAGAANTLGNFNAFFGFNAGAAIVTEFNNAFFGARAGESNRGFSNAFFGTDAGRVSTLSDNNTFIGAFAGVANTTGSNNLFLGRSAGDTNTTGSNNTIIGSNANVASNGLGFATVLGADAIVTASNRIQLGRDGLDMVSIGTLATASAVHVCINDTVLSSCSSSRRYKQNVQPLRAGLNLVSRLQPVTFDWKGRVEPDLGLIAEEVAKVEPLLVTRNKDGVIEGVKYDQLAVVLINAVKEQQAQIAAQQRQITQLQNQVRTLLRRPKRATKR